MIPRGIHALLYVLKGIGYNCKEIRQSKEYSMTASTITSKGQLTIPKAVRDQLGLQSGDRVEFRVEADGTARMLPISLRASDVAGMLASKTRNTSTIDEMDAFVAAAFRKGKL
jgi:AbrB family looped-hinge helix DNA binding protein